MEREHVHRLVVVREDDERIPIGVLSISDLVHAMVGAAGQMADLVDPDASPLSKVQGEPKEHHEARLGAALPLFDVHAYVDDFNRSIVAAYRRGVADAELAGRRRRWPAASSRRAPPRPATSAASRRGSPTSSASPASAA